MDILIIILFVCVAVTIVRRLPESSCTGNCNQGRNCTCKGTTNE